MMDGLGIAGLALGEQPSGAHQEIVGTAFAITHEVGVTAFHCVGDRTRGELTSDRVTLFFPGYECRASIIEDGSNPDLDFVFIRFDERLREPLEIITLRPTTAVNVPFVVKGWPSKRPAVDSPVSTGGVVRDPSARLAPSVPALQLHSDEASEGLPLGGMSGAPVLVQYDTTHCAVGMIRWNFTDEASPAHALAGIVFATRAANIIAAAFEHGLASELMPPVYVSYGVDGHDLAWARWIVSVMQGHRFDASARFATLRPGDNFHRVIDSSLDLRPVVLVVVSANYGKVGDSISKYEQQAVSRYPGRIIPVTIEDCRVPKFLAELYPIRLDELQAHEAEQELVHALSAGAVEVPASFPGRNFGQLLTRDRIIPAVEVAPSSQPPREVE